MTNCIFCQIVARTADAVIVHEDADVVAFLDNRPIRRGHTLIVTRSHVETFDALDPSLANHVVVLGQHLARGMKAIYKVERVGFLFAGSDVAHVHAHVIPMHERMDLTSARYLVSPEPARWDSEHLITEHSELQAVRRELDIQSHYPL